MTQTDGNGRRLAINASIAMVLAIAAGFAIRHFTRSEVEIRAARAGFTDLVSSISTNGKVEPVQNFEAHASEPGAIEAVYVRNGQTVQAGTMLLRMNTAAATARVETARSSIAQAQAAQYDIRNGGSTDERIGIQGDLNRAQLQSTQAQNDLDALKALQARGAASANEVAAAQQRLASAQSSLASLQQRTTARYAATDKQRVQAQLSDSQAALAAASHSLANSVVRAPFAGTVYSLPVRPYDFVAGGEELIQLADLTRLQVRAYFDEPEIGRLKVGQQVVIKWDARPTDAWHGHIVRTPTTIITYGTRNVGECLIAVDDPTGGLLPSTNVNVSVTTQQISHVLSIPREALRTLGTDNFVYIVRKGVLEKQPVSVGALNLLNVQITSGLNAGDVLALSAVSSSVDLAEGQRVKVIQ